MATTKIFAPKGWGITRIKNRVKKAYPKTMVITKVTKGKQYKDGAEFTIHSRRRK